MDLLIYFRQLIANNFYRNPNPANEDAILVLPSLSNIADFNVGQEAKIVAVNRTTGEIYIKWS